MLLSVGIIRPPLISRLFRRDFSSRQRTMRWFGFTFLILFVSGGSILSSENYSPPINSNILVVSVSELEQALKGSCGSEIAKVGDDFLVSRGYSEQPDGSFLDSQGEYPTPEVETEMEELQTQKLKDCASSDSGLSNLVSVVKVVDGDTIDVDLDGKTERLRLIGIDTPETVDPRKIIQCFGIEASNKSKEILTGNQVRLEADSSQGERDKYNRLLRYVFLEDGTNFNQLMIKQGYAHEYTYDTDYKYQQEFKDAENYARQNRLGLWSDSTCAGNTNSSGIESNVNTTTTIPDISPTPVVPSAPKQKYACDCSKTCSEITTCDEAQYQLKVCGCSVRDRDGDGIACDTMCQ